MLGMAQIQHQLRRIEIFSFYILTEEDKANVKRKIHNYVTSSRPFVLDSSFSHFCVSLRLNCFKFEFSFNIKFNITPLYWVGWYWNRYQKYWLILWKKWARCFLKAIKVKPSLNNTENFIMARIIYTKSFSHHFNFHEVCLKPIKKSLADVLQYVC